MVLYIRKCLAYVFAEYASGVQILYGGSAAPENAAEIMMVGAVDGFLVGRVSLEAEKFSEMITVIHKIK
jgi:triosephosphate isomerase